MSYTSRAIVLLLVCGYCSAQGTGNCNPSPPNTLNSSLGTFPNGVPSFNGNGHCKLKSVLQTYSKIMRFYF